MYSMICIFAIHLSVEVHLSCFHNLAIVNSASTKTRIFEILQMAHLQMEKNELVWVSFAEWERVAFRSLMGNIRRIESKARFFDSHVKACSFTRWLVNLSVLLSASRWNYIPSGQFHILTRESWKTDSDNQLHKNKILFLSALLSDLAKSTVL